MHMTSLEHVAQAFADGRASHTYHTSTKDMQKVFVSNKYYLYFLHSLISCCDLCCVMQYGCDDANLDALLNLMLHQYSTKNLHLVREISVYHIFASSI